MKSKKSFLSLGIIALVLFLGVGYAVVSSVYLNIGGTASVNDQDLNVEITNAVASTNIAEKTVGFTHVLSNKNLTSNFTLNEMVLNEVVTITYTVTNNEKDVDAELSLASGVELSNSNSDYFDVDYEITDNETDLENNDKTMEVVVTVGLIKTPVTEENSSTTVELTLTASPKGGNSGSGSGTEIEATEIYYNQPYNAVVSTETVASDTATYARNGQSYNVTNLYNNVSELQVKAKTLAETNDKHVKSLVVYDDSTVEIFMDGTLINTYPSSSVAIEGQTLNVTDGFEAQISSDFKTITVGEEVYELNTIPSPLKIGPEHIYSGAYVEDFEHDMAMGVVFKNNTHLDVYFNGYLIGQSSTQYFTVGNMVYTQDPGENVEPYAYVSLDGTQLIQKGKCILKYQGKEKVFYGRAYSTFGSYDDDVDTDKMSIVLYRDGSFDVIIDYILMQKMPAGTLTINGNNININDGEEALDFIITNDGYNIIYVENGVQTGIGLAIDDMFDYSIIKNKKFNLTQNGTFIDKIIFDESRTYTSENGEIGDFIISEKSIILDDFPYVFEYNEDSGEYICNANFDGESSVVKLVPVE